MRKLLFIAFLFPALCFGQRFAFPSTAHLGSVAGVDSASWEQGYKNYYYAVTAENRPGIDIADLQNTLYSDLQRDSLDIFYIFANKSYALARLNLMNPTGDDNCTTPLPAGVTFTPYEGITGDGSTGVNSFFNPNTEGVALKRYSSSLFVYSRTNVTNQQYYDMGSDIEFSLTCSFNASAALTRMHNATVTSGAVSNSLGLFVGTRTANNAIVLYQGTTSKATGTEVTNAVLNNYLEILSRAGSYYSQRQLSIAGAGAGVSSTEVSTYLNTPIEAYMDGLGKGVQ